MGFGAGDYKWSVSDRENMSSDDKIGKILTPDDLFFPEMGNDEEEAGCTPETILRNILNPMSPPLPLVTKKTQADTLSTG